MNVVYVRSVYVKIVLVVSCVKVEGITYCKSKKPSLSW